MNNEELTAKAAAFTVFICILFGANPVAVKFCLTGIGVFTSAGIRFAIAGLVIFSWARLKGIPLALSRKQLGQMMILSAIFFTQLSCFYHGLAKTTASHGVLIANMLPFVVLILAHFFIPGDRITLRKGVGIALGFVGVLFLIFDTQDISGNLKSGDLLVFTAVLFWGMNVTFVKRVISEYNAVQITIYPMIFAVPLFFLSGFFRDHEMIFMVDRAVVTAMLYQSFITASFGFIAWNSLLSRFGATALHTFVFIMPLSGVLFGVLLLNETVTPKLAVSVILIVTGVIIVNFKRRKGRTHPINPVQ